MDQQEEIGIILKKQKLRLTKTRQSLLLLFFCQSTPLSVSQILRGLEKNGLHVNKTTVYRELQILEKRGIVQSTQLQDRKRYFELTTRGHHHHLVCLECEQIEDIDVNEKELLQEEYKVSREKNFTILHHSLEFFGLCQHCQSV